MTVAEGFEVELVAAEPLVRQPVAIEFDDRGRLWVVQYLQYPNPAGLKRVKVDRYSRIEYDRVPEPPPHGPKGSDCIAILEDTDGDGRADRAKNFVEGLNLASGIAFGRGGVFVLNVPYLLFYPDRNGDDVPDGDPEMLLTGFGMHDAHSVANSLTWGPDGWLYGCQGSTVTANIRGIEFQQGVWRYRPESDEFELFCEGGGNSWGLDFDLAGNLIYSTNFGGYVGLHGVQGAYLVKSFGKHGALHNPYAFGYFDHIPYENFQGGHVTVGGTLYYGTTFPSQFRGTLIAGDLLGHAVHWHTLERDGSTFRSAHGGTLLAANDTWFAPSDVTLGPDGAIYVADWHDSRTAHPDPDAEWDRRNGRVYRIQWKEARPAPPVDLSVMAPNVADFLDGDNQWYVRRARRMLAERSDAHVYLSRLERPLSSQLALEMLWISYGSRGSRGNMADRGLKHSDEDVRAWCVRMLGDRGQAPGSLPARLAEMARTDPSNRVRSQLACSAKRLPADVAIPIIAELAQRDEDAGDRYIPLLLWWAVEQHAASEPQALIDWLATPAMQAHPLVRDVLLERLMQRLAAASALEACSRLLQSVTGELHRRLFVALDTGLKLRHSQVSTGFGDGTLFDRFAPTQAKDTGGGPGLQTESVPPVLATEVKELLASGTTDPVALRVAIQLGFEDAAQRVLELALNRETDQSTRLAMFEVLRELGRDDCVESLLGAIDGDDREEIQLAALAVLARFDRPRIAEVVQAAYPQMSPALRVKARELLFGRKLWASAFLAGVDSGTFDAKEVGVEELRRIALHQDAELDALVRKHWGGVRAGTPDEKLAEMRRLSNDLRAASGDVDSGRELFKKHCATCHRLHNDGNQVGPDLTHANRADREFLLASLVDPSAQVRKEFLSYVVVTTDGRVLTGLIAEQTPADITLLDAKNQRIRIPQSDVESLEESDVSLMPENILKPFSAEELRDLFAYLQG